MRKRLASFRIVLVLVLVLQAIACSFLSGSAPGSSSTETPTSWMLALNTPTLIAATAPPDVSVPPVIDQQDVSILKCQNDPAHGFVRANAPVTLVWGWVTDNGTKRDEIISISSFILELDGQTRDTSAVKKALESTNTVYWKLSIGKVAPGTHEIRLTRILAREFTESSGTTPAGQQGVETCKLVVQ